MVHILHYGNIIKQSAMMHGKAGDYFIKAGEHLAEFTGNDMICSLQLCYDVSRFFIAMEWLIFFFHSVEFGDKFMGCLDTKYNFFSFTAPVKTIQDNKSWV